MRYHFVQGLVDRMNFGEWLKKARLEQELSLRELASRTNGACTFGYLSQLENRRGGKKGIYRPDLEIVDAIADALGKSKDEARYAAGYATTSPTKPQTLPELISALESLGLDMPLFYDDLPDDPEAFRETIERIYLDVKLVIERTLTRSQERRLNEIQNKLANPPTRKLDTVELIR